MKYIKQLLFFFLCSAFQLNAQTELFFENFNGVTNKFQVNTTDVSSTTDGILRWIINDAYTGGTVNMICGGFPLPAPVVDTPNQPGGVDAGPKSKYMHVTTTGGISDGIPNCHYMTADGFCNPNAENIFSKMTSDISTVGYSDITLSFWWLCAPTEAQGEVYYSTNGGGTWTLVPGLPSFTNTPNWILTSKIIPEFLNQSTLRLGFRFVNPIATSGEDPAFGVDDIKITGTSATPSTITTGGVSAGPYCAGDAIDIPFAVSGPFGAGNIFTAQLSDASGNFTSPVLMGTLNGSTNGVISATIPAGTASGTYKIRVVSNSPVVTGSEGPVSITVNAAPTATILPSSTAAVCNGGTATLNASGGGTYKWYSSATGSGFTEIPGANSPDYTSGPLSADSYYQVKVTNNCGESTSSTWKVTLQSVVNIPLTLSPASGNLCNGPVTVTVSGTFSNLTWTGGGSGNTATFSTPQTVSVTGTDPNNCPAASEPVEITDTEPLPLVISPTGQATLCGSSLNLTASTGFTDYQWSNGGTGNPLTVSAVGTYSVSATDINGCRAKSEDVEVVAGDIALIEITPANPAICSGQSVVLTASAGFTNYVWSNGATGSSITVNRSGTFSVTATSADGGCPGESVPVNVTESNFPIANFAYTQENGNKIKFDNTSQNGVNYTWSFASFGTSTSENPSFTFTELGPYYITLIASNGCGSDTIRKLVVVTDVGFEKWLHDMGFRIFPNPSAGDFFLSVGNSLAGKLHFDWIDLNGRLSGRADALSGENGIVTLPARHLAPGIYLLKVSNDEGKVALFRMLKSSF